MTVSIISKLIHYFVRGYAYIKSSWKMTNIRHIIAYTKGGLIRKITILTNLLKEQGGLIHSSYKVFGILKRDGINGFRFLVISKVKSVLSERIIGEDILKSLEVNGFYNIMSEPHYIDPYLNSPPLIINKSVAIHLHLFYHAHLEHLTNRLRHIPCNFDLFVSLNDDSLLASVDKYLRGELPNIGKLIIEAVPNKGRNIGPLIIQFGSRLLQYDIIAHFHTKKSPHNDVLVNWGNDILDLLLGPAEKNRGQVSYIFKLLENDVKIVYPEGQYRIIKDKTGWANNYAVAAEFLSKFTKISIDDYPVVEFPEGSMFWARTFALKEYLQLPIKWNMFQHEPLPADGSLAHALERLLLVFASRHKGKNIRLHRGDSIHDYRYYEEVLDYSNKLIHKDVKVLSYYLPQFYAIPENDFWHGKGFTEWIKVRAANPLFSGHYQQNIPHEDIGYYQLESTDTLRKQADMMRKAGVHGQVFYHYWFHGKTLLEKPSQMLIESKDIDMPFCFCWANENWTRTWDGNELEILLEQKYSADDALAFIEYLIPFFKDSRYINIDGRPLLFIYRPSSIPDPAHYIDIWGNICKIHGLKKPYIAAILTRGAVDPRVYSMDGGVERVLHDWTDGAVKDIRDQFKTYQPLKGSVLPYEDVVKFYCNQKSHKEFDYFRSAVPNFDNTPRYSSEAFMLHGSTPKLFQDWLEKIILHSKETLPENRRFVLINAWNEWAESAHLEPDSKFGYAYLNSIGRALSGEAYKSGLNPVLPVPKDLIIKLSFEKGLNRQLALDPELCSKFIYCLQHSNLLERVSIITENVYSIDLNSDRNGASINSLMNKLSFLPETDVKPDFTFIFSKAVLFEPDLLLKMLQTALYCKTSIILPYFYDRKHPLIKITDNGSVNSFLAYHSPILLIPRQANYKNYRTRTDALTFVEYPSSSECKNKPIITTIVRYHKSNSLKQLKNALYCLAAMEDCIVIPFIAVQDLDELQLEELRALLNDVPLNLEYGYRLEMFFSENGKGDLRSLMLNKCLQLVNTRYVAFLDYDDLLMSHAYKIMLNRLKQTGKAVTFGRVYSTDYNLNTGVFGDRNKVYINCKSHRDFMVCNDLPIHSFLMDLSLLDVKQVRYSDNQRYLEDYFLTLQLFTEDNCDWESLKHNIFIGDYIHFTDNSNTLAIIYKDEREQVINNTEYQNCAKLVNGIKDKIKLL